MSKTDHKKTDVTENTKRWCIAITGAVATGKSTVASIIKNQGYTVIDADQLARDVVQPGESAFTKIVEVFGEIITTPDGQLDRGRLRDIVMSNPSYRKKLESIMHPAIQQRLEDHINNSNLGYGKIFFYEASLIFELGREKFFKECWVTSCTEDTQLKRLEMRSKLSREKCLEIIHAQWSNAAKIAKADIIIDTECSMDELVRKVKEIMKARLP